MSPETPLKGLQLAVVDTETSGLDVNADHVIEVAVAHLTLGDDALPTLAYTTRIRPPVPLDPGSRASRTHGLTAAMLADAPAWAAQAQAFESAIGDRVLVAHNATFDYGMVRSEQARAGRDVPAWPWIDSRVPATFRDRYGASLAAVCTSYGISLDAHGAAGDALAVGLVLPQLLAFWWRTMRDVMSEALWELPPATLGTYLHWQRGAAFAQEAAFVANVRRKLRGYGTQPDCPWHDMEGVARPDWPSPPAPTWKVEKDGRVMPVETP